jgi:hypothetical protein
MPCTIGQTEDIAVRTEKRAAQTWIRAFPTSLEEFAKPLIPAEGLGPRHKWSGTR